jgi:hypothetical protein
MISKAQATKEKNRLTGFQKQWGGLWKTQLKSEKIIHIKLANQISDKGLLARIYKIPFHNKKTNT